MSPFAGRLRPLGRVLELEGWFVWCTSPILGPDGRVHLFFSRWRAELGMGGWISACEIARAVADRPEGPYEVMDTVLAPRGGDWFDATTCHNPHIQFIDGRWCLFYMGNRNKKTDTKRIGLAIADSLDGPWQRPDCPLLEAGPDGAWDDHCTTNPAFIRHPSGQYWLYYKSWNTAEYATATGPIRGNRKYGLAIADRLEGPYRRHPANPVIDFSTRGHNEQFEDAFIWHEDGRFKLIARDMGFYNHEVGLYFESADGIHWPPPAIAYHAAAHYITEPPPPQLKRWGRFERPQLLIRDGHPTHLFCAMQGGRFATASAFVFRLDEPTQQPLT